MRRGLLLGLLAIALGLCVSGCYQGGIPLPRMSPKPTGPVKEGIHVGDRAPDIRGEDADHNPFKLSDYRGKVVLLDFWAGW
jgi:cytochrome oxidase Cu insertion factor (SCO1/SenC/PrrC family)